MPIIKSAKKALRQNRKNEARNRHFKDLYRESRVAFEQAIKSNDAKKASEVFYNTKKDWKTVSSGLQSIIDKLEKKNILHKNNASRKKAKFAAQLKSVSKK